MAASSMNPAAEAPVGAAGDGQRVTYLTTEQLAARIHYDARTIRTRLKDTKLIEGRHYIRPFGGRKLLFVWEAIEREFNLSPVSLPAQEPIAPPTPPSGPSPEVVAATQASRAAMDAARQAIEAATEAIEVAQRAQAGAPPPGSWRAAHKPGNPIVTPPPAGWSEEEMVQLIATGGEPESLAALAEATGRSPRSVRERWARLLRETNIKPRTNARAPILRWTQEELDWLRSHYASASAEDLVARFPHRRLVAVRIRASELGLTLPRKRARELAVQRKAAGSLGPRAAEHDVLPGETGESPTNTASVSVTPDAPVPSPDVIEAVAKGLRAGERIGAIYRRLNLTREQAENAAFMAGLSAYHPRRWSPHQDEAVTRAFREGGHEAALKAIPERTPLEVDRRLRVLGLGLPQPWVAWTEPRLSYLIASAKAGRDIDEVAYNLVLSRSEVYSKMIELAKLANTLTSRGPGESTAA